jgi:hypothetical protein
MNPEMKTHNAYENFTRELIMVIPTLEFMHPKREPYYDHVNCKLLYDLIKTLMNSDCGYIFKEFKEEIRSTNKYQYVLFVEELIRHLSVTANFYLATKRPLEVGYSKFENTSHMHKHKYKMFIPNPKDCERILWY